MEFTIPPDKDLSEDGYYMGTDPAFLDSETPQGGAICFYIKDGYVRNIFVPLEKKKEFIEKFASVQNVDEDDIKAFLEKKAPEPDELQFKQTRDISEFRPLIDTLIPDFDYVFLHTILQWCKLAEDPYENCGQFWELFLVTLPDENLKQKTVAICGLYSIVPDSTDELWLGWFGIVPELRNRGLGKDIMKFLYTEAGKTNCKQLLSYVDKEGKPLSFYKREGFEVIGTVKEYLEANKMKKIDGDNFESGDDFVIKKNL